MPQLVTRWLSECRAAQRSAVWPDVGSAIQFRKWNILNIAVFCPLSNPGRVGHHRGTSQDVADRRGVPETTGRGFDSLGGQALADGAEREAVAAQLNDSVDRFGRQRGA